ncbi:rRNA pseudouridine synthase [Rasiella rasia]|uniref:rRNA pseudouridine synthase n=1 Tax=Rasiella rasia TaxID=2744027 RepID=A0A6G6GLP4_9FLAO|nr:S4 domain-containing protein [Rasiella rasia]QIE59437.1 rRNA pseudouridine synthase [Rasiella rasia]
MSRQDNTRKGKTSGRGGAKGKGKSTSRGNAPVKSTGHKKSGAKPLAPKRRNAEGALAGKASAAKKKTVNKTEGIRLNKYIANSGVCSRREADTYIATGLVTVNGKVINEMGHKVKREDDVRFDGRRINPELDTYILLNKPKSVASTTSESKGLTVMDLISNATSANVMPVGRLGRNATGLILFTNDDALMKKFHSKGMERLFHVELNKNLKAADIDAIREGISIKGETHAVEEISYVKNASKKEVGLKIKNMGNSIIRTIFEHLGYNVVKVDCVTIAHLTKKDLPRGRWKVLTKQEIELFSML